MTEDAFALVLVLLVLLDIVGATPRSRKERAFREALERVEKQHRQRVVRDAIREAAEKKEGVPLTVLDALKQIHARDCFVAKVLE